MAEPTAVEQMRAKAASDRARMAMAAAPPQVRQNIATMQASHAAGPTTPLSAVTIDGKPLVAAKTEGNAPPARAIELSERGENAKKNLEDAAAYIKDNVHLSERGENAIANYNAARGVGQQGDQAPRVMAPGPQQQMTPMGANPQPLPPQAVSTAIAQPPPQGSPVAPVPYAPPQPVPVQQVQPVPVPQQVAAQTSPAAIQAQLAALQQRGG
jgi:hypothetical protein